MSGEISTIQSLKAVDAWIDVINANINGGVRTAFKSSRLKFSGSNTDIQHAGNSTSLPLQFPEPGLTTANTLIDFTQGAITASTETSHLAIQGEGFFVLCNAAAVAGGATWVSATTKLYLTRDGEFHTDSNGLLVNSQGLYLCVPNSWAASGNMGQIHDLFPVYDDLSNGLPSAIGAVKLSDYMTGIVGTPQLYSNGAANPGTTDIWIVLAKVQNKEILTYSTYGSTIYDFGWSDALYGYNGSNLSLPNVPRATPADASILSKSLEASNSSMTQSVPELSLAQKLFSALTKVLQTKQTNVDGVLNLVR